MSKDCCEDMTDHLERVCSDHPDRDFCPDAIISRVGGGGYGLLIHDGEDGHASSVIAINYCPWCGQKLAPVAAFRKTSN
jgi:hypothetical protein